MLNIQNAPSLKKYLFELALSTKLQNMKNHDMFGHYLYDTLIFKKIRNILGG